MMISSTQFSLFESSPNLSYTTIDSISDENRTQIIPVSETIATISSNSSDGPAAEAIEKTSTSITFEDCGSQISVTSESQLFASGLRSIDRSISQNIPMYDRTASSHNVSDQFTKLSQSTINVTQEDEEDEEDEEDIVDVPKYGGSRDNFCSDLMDLEVGFRPMDNLILTNLSHLRFSAAADDEFVPSPIPNETSSTSASSQIPNSLSPPLVISKRP